VWWVYRVGVGFEEFGEFGVRFGGFRVGVGLESLESWSEVWWVWV
jgi:hypothetical protein